MPFPIGSSFGTQRPIPRPSDDESASGRASGPSVRAPSGATGWSGRLGRLTSRFTDTILGGFYRRAKSVARLDPPAFAESPAPLPPTRRPPLDAGQHRACGDHARAMRAIQEVEACFAGAAPKRVPFLLAEARRYEVGVVPYAQLSFDLRCREAEDRWQALQQIQAYGACLRTPADWIAASLDNVNMWVRELATFRETDARFAYRWQPEDIALELRTLPAEVLATLRGRVQSAQEHARQLSPGPIRVQACLGTDLEWRAYCGAKRVLGTLVRTLAKQAVDRDAYGAERDTRPDLRWTAMAVRVPAYSNHEIALLLEHQRR